MIAVLAYLNSLSRSQVNKIIEKYLTKDYSLQEQVKFRMGYLYDILADNRIDPSIPIRFKDQYNLWSQIYSVAYRIYVNDYFGKPNSHNSYKGIVKLTDIFIEYMIDEILDREELAEQEYDRNVLGL